MEAVMETFTIQAVYEKGVLKPGKKLNLPEHSLVEIRVKSVRVLNKKTEFASLLGVWEDTDFNLEKSLAQVGTKSKAKVKKLENL
jgi:predicted DNA-binding antitoxin AbrB/MazE fold protein